MASFTAIGVEAREARRAARVAAVKAERDGLAAELARMAPALAGSEWEADRRDALAFADRELARLEAL
jgi:hypothetical protein